MTLPRKFDYGTMYHFIAPIVRTDGYPSDAHFIFDFKDLAFIEGAGLTVFCNTLAWLQSHGVKTHFTNVAPANNAVSYLDDCGFFDRFQGQKLRAHAKPRVSTLPSLMVAYADSHGWLEYSFTPWLANVLGVEAAALGSVRSCIKEIFNNILDHSTRNSGFVHVQHYPRGKIVQIAISDFGRGIPATVRNKITNLDDGAAI